MGEWAWSSGGDACTYMQHAVGCRALGRGDRVGANPANKNVFVSRGANYSFGLGCLTMLGEDIDEGLAAKFITN